MSFAAPLWLLPGALALAMVILLHALRRDQFEVPSLILWRRIAAAGRPRSSLRLPRWNLLLVLQLVAVVLLTLALARPAIGPEPRPLHEVFILDASGSMRGSDVAPSRFEAAREILEADLASRQDRGRISVLTAALEPTVRVARQTDSKAVVPLVASLAAGDGEADWEAVAGWLPAIVRVEEDTRIVVLTDAPAAARDAILAQLPEAAVAVRSFGTQTPNAGLRSVALVPIEGGESFSISGRLSIAAGAQPPEVTARFRPEGGASFLEWTRFVPSPPDEEATGALIDVPFEEEIDLPGDGLLELALTPDAFPHDDVYRLEVRKEPPRLSVLHIGESDPALELALLARADVDLLSATDAPQEMSGYDLVIADNVVLEARPPTNLLWLGTARLAGEPAPEDVSTVAPGWDASHPLSEGVRWSAIAPDGALAAPAMAGATVLLGSREAALVEARTTPSGREMRVGLPVGDTAWARTPALPVFLSNVLDWLDARPSPCTAGEPCRFPARLLASGIADAGGAVMVPPVPSDAESLPDDANVFYPARAGLYRIGDGALAYEIIVNPAHDPLSAVSATGDEPEPPAPPPARLDVWLVGAAVAVMLLEAILAAREAGLFRGNVARAPAGPATRALRFPLALRAVSLLLAFAALLQLPLPAPAPTEPVVLVAEPGFTGDPSRPRLLAQVDEANCGFSGNALGLVSLGQSAEVVADICGGHVPPAEGEPAGVNLAEAVQLAVAMLRPDFPGRVVIAGDGSDTGMLSAAPIFAATRDRAVVVDALPLADWQAGDSLVSALELPGQPAEGDRMPLTALVHSASGGEATIEVSADGEPVNRQDVTLSPGANRITTLLPEFEEGVHHLRVEVSGAGDPVPENGSQGIAVEVDPAPAVALVTSQPAWGDYFAEALALQGIRTEILAPNRAPFYLSGWLEYAAVALLNVPAIELDSKQQDQLERFVREHGRGLLILGGENTFGPGGYFQTPLEAVSPLSAKIPKDLPVAALGFVLDRSGSMQALVEGVSRLEVAKQATLSAVGLLNEDSQVSVVVFDTLPAMLMPMQDKDLAALEASLAPLVPGGGTSIYPALEEMVAEMEKADTPTRHIIVMSDGLSQPGDFPGLVARAAERGITISAVAIGRGADITTLEEIARLGGGSFHVSQDFRALPSILSQEAMMLSSEAMEAGVRAVAWVDRDDPFLSGMPASMPAIESYVLTTAKAEAKLHLATEDDQGEVVPILASWRYGNGSVLALATHAAGPGGVRWMQLPQYPLLWSQVVRHFLPTTPGPGIEATMTREGDRIEIAAEILDEEGEPVAGLAPVATVGRDGTTVASDLSLKEVAPGRYAAGLRSAGPGQYSAGVSAGEDYAATGFLDITYPARLDFSRAAPERLSAIAAATGGRVLSEEARLTSGAIRWTLAPAWLPWVLASFTVFLADLVARYAPRFLPAPRFVAAKPALRPQWATP